MIEYHRQLLADETRTHAYRDAIRRVVRPGDVVVDLGCGSGILSFFACEAGASRVYAIDMTHAADAASFLARHLGFADRIHVLHADAREVELPERADVLVTETLGAIGLDEGITALVRDARARMLKPDARIIPSRVAVDVVPVELSIDYARRVAWWSQPRYGLDLSAMRVFASNSIAFARIDTLAHLAQPAEVLNVDLAHNDSPSLEGRASFTSRRNGELHGFGIYFKAALADGVSLTNCDRRTSSWTQAFLPLEQPVRLTRGAEIDVELQTEDGRVWRWRGSAAGSAFDQTTWLAAPPCQSNGPR